MAASLLLASIWSLPQYAHARLDETEGECEKRYGPGKEYETNKWISVPLLEGRVPHRIYDYKGWVILIAFIGNVSVSERYVKSSAAGKSRQITPAEIEVLLEANRGKGHWSPTEDGKAWNRSDKATAVLRGSTMIVFSTPMAELYKASKAYEKEEKEKAAVPKF